MRNGQTVDLTGVQFDLLLHMAKHPGRVYTRLQLLEVLQDHAFEGYERTVDVHIKNIRKALEPDPSQPRYMVMYPADREHLDRLYEETLHLSNLVSELPDLADAAEAGSSSYAFEVIDLCDLLGHLIATYKAEATAKSVRLLFEKGENPSCKIFGDRDKIEQAVSNLLSNALRYTPDKGSVRIELSREENSVEIAVEDTGEGVGEEEREKIFERFYRVESDRNRVSGGSGLGLAIVGEIVKAHEGEVRVRAAKRPEGHGTGARFELRFPLQSSHQ